MRTIEDTMKRYHIHRISENWLDIHSNDGTWIAEGQVFAKPSRYGIGARDNDGNWLCDPYHLPASARISRLTINNLAENQCVYNYDRGLDFDRTPPGLLDEFIAVILKG